MKKKEKFQPASFPFLNNLTLIMFTLKLCGIINTSWMIVFLPTSMPLILGYFIRVLNRMEVLLGKKIEKLDK